MLLILFFKLNYNPQYKFKLCAEHSRS